MKRTWLIPAGFLLLASAAQARPSFSIQGMLGFNGEADSDKATDTDKLTSDFGLMGTVEFPISREFRLGGRLAYEGATGDDSKTDYSMLDGGLWARFVFLPGRFEAFAAGGLGLSSITADPDAGTKLDGTGYHFLLGAGASFPVSRQMRVIGGLYYANHLGDLEGDNNAEVKGFTLSRILFTGGVMF